MATSKPSGTNCPKSSFRSTAPPPKEKCGSSNTSCKTKAKKRKKQGQKNQTSEPEVSHSQHVKSISSKTKRTKGQNDQKRSNQYQAKVPRARPRPLNLKPNGHQPTKSSPRAKDNQAVIAAGSHLFPSRTEKLSPPAPMVLHTSVGE